MWSALAPGARAGAARAGDDSGRVPDVWATLAGALQVRETERGGEGLGEGGSDTLARTGTQGTRRATLLA